MQSDSLQEKADILQLKGLHAFLKSSFSGVSFGPFKIDDGVESLERAIKTLETKLEK
jgi:hypothetical protein